MFSSEWDRFSGEFERAKQVVAEIIRQAGGVLVNKTNLFKAFYHAHLKFAAANPNYLSSWPIVKMPHGPGIDSADALLGGLMLDGVIIVDQIEQHGYSAFRFIHTGKQCKGEPLPDEAIAAIQAGLDQVLGKSAKTVSDESHAMSRSWRAATKEGEELNIYADLSDDGEYQERVDFSRSITPIVDEIWGAS